MSDSSDMLQQATAGLVVFFGTLFVLTGDACAGLTALLALAGFGVLSGLAHLARASDERLRLAALAKACREADARNAAISDEERERARLQSIAALERARAILDRARFGGS